MNQTMSNPDTYALKAAAVTDVAAPDIPHPPPMPRHYRPHIGVIGAGGIVGSHLSAYRTARWNVAAICSHALFKARVRAEEFAPKAMPTLCVAPSLK